MPQNDEVELEITNVAHGGVFVARHEGRVLFVSDTLPGERVQAYITDRSHKSFWRAETRAVLRQAPERVDHVWPAAALERQPGMRAGGAEFGHIALGHQRELKRRVLVDSLQRMGKLSEQRASELCSAVEPALDESADGRGWRTRVRLHVASDGRIGPFASRTHTVIPVDDYPLATPAVQGAIPFADRYSNAQSLDVIATSTGEVHVLVNEEHSTSRASGGHPVRIPLRERAGQREFRVDARGFWQIHRQAPATLTAAVQDAVDSDLFDPRAANLDLYGGVGLFAAALGDLFGMTTRITTVEANRNATDDAAENLSEWIGATALTARVDSFLRQLNGSASAMERARLRSATVILDPPRSGAGREVVESLALIDPAQIIYVACDPVALSRDIATFADHGFVPQTLRAFDLFPHTHHLETVVRLVRPERG